MKLSLTDTIRRSLRMRLILIFSLPLICIVAFGLIYFPRQQKSMGVDMVKKQTHTLSEMLAFSVGAGLKDGNFELVQTAFEWAKRDSSVAYVCILDETQNVIVEHNPHTLAIDTKAAALKEGIISEEPFLTVVAPIHSADKRIGTIILAYSMNEIQARIQSQLVVSFIIELIVFALGILAIAMVTRMIVRQIHQILGAMEQFADGDLTVHLDTNRSDEIGQLSQGVNRAVGQVNTMMKEVLDAVSMTNEASNQIGVSTEELAAGAQQQTAQISEVASAVEEMTKTIIENSKNATGTSETARQARAAAESGGKIVEDTVTGMKRIADVVNKSAETVKILGQSSDQIGEIIGVIDDIADQTNLLALNAAIEAARAGEQGRGFSVVADEVRKLAERTTKATKEIAQMISKIQSETAGAVVSMEQGTKEVMLGIQLVDKAGSSLSDIVDISQRVTDMITQIAAASEQQSNTSETISKNVDAINNVINESASGTQQIARSAEDLNRLTANLQKLVEKFKLSHEEAAQPAPRRQNVEKSSIAVRSNGVLVPHH
jgi:methyl-accepting chemotaxis protein